MKIFDWTILKAIDTFFWAHSDQYKKAKTHCLNLVNSTGNPVLLNVPSYDHASELAICTFINNCTQSMLSSMLGLSNDEIKSFTKERNLKKFDSLRELMTRTDSVSSDSVMNVAKHLENSGYSISTK